MPRTQTRWLVAWFGPDGKFRDAIEHPSTIRPKKWAARRCAAGETFDFWNIGDPADEQRARAQIDTRR